MSECLFCRIVAGEIPADVVLESEEVLAFRDIAPQAPVHVLVIPKRHEASIGDLAKADDALAGRLLQAAAQVAEAEGVGDRYRLVCNTGAAAGQSVFHAHAHVLGDRPMGWPPG